MCIRDRVKFNTDLRRLRLGLAENHLLARDVKNELQAGYRRELDALVEAEAASLIDQVYGRRFEQDVRPYLRQPQPVSGRQLRTILGAPQQGLVLDSLQLSAQQQAQAGALVLIHWQFPGGPERQLDLLQLYLSLIHI